MLDKGDILHQIRRKDFIMEEPKLFEVVGGPGSLTLGVRLGDVDLIQDVIFKVKVEFQFQEVSGIRVRLKTLHCLNPDKQYWRIDGIVIAGVDWWIPEESRVRIFYAPKEDRKGYLLRQISIDDLTLGLIVDRLYILEEDNVSRWPTGLLEYTIGMKGTMTKGVRDIFRRWVLDNPGHALDWFKAEIESK
jgi:hypothetical protein